MCIRDRSITLCVILNAKKLEKVFVTLCIQIEWLFYIAFWCETVTRKWRWRHPWHGGTCPHFYKWLGTGAPRVRKQKEESEQTVLATRKRSCEMTYIVLVGAINSTHSLTYTKTTDCTSETKKVEGTTKNFLALCAWHVPSLLNSFQRRRIGLHRFIVIIIG